MLPRIFVTQAFESVTACVTVGVLPSIFVTQAFESVTACVTVGVLPRIVVTQALESVTACVTVGNFCYPAATEHKKHTKAWWSGLHFHCLHPRQKRAPLCLQPLPRLLLTGPPPHPLVLVPLLPPHLGPLTLLAVTAAGCTAKLITWVHIPDLVVLPLVPLQPLLLFLEGPNQTWTPLARQFQWGWALVGGPQMQHDPNVAPGLNNPGIQVFLAEFRQVLGPQLQ